MILILKEYKHTGGSGLTETVRVVRGNFQYIDGVITKQQATNLKKFGNTVLDALVYQKVGKRAILAEIKRMTELDCEIREVDGSIIVEVAGRRSKVIVRKN